jgi:ribose transport system substrate-binding protein
LRTAAPFVAALAIVAALVGCGRPVSPGKPRVALVMKSLANEFFSTMENGARQHQSAHAAEYDLLASGIKDEADVAAQIALVEQMIAQRVDAIVIAPADSKALLSVCKKALDTGIVVVNIDNRLDAGVQSQKGTAIPFVGPDNRKGARAVGEYLAARLKPGDPVAIVEGAPNAFNATQRRLGFEDAMSTGGMRVVASQSANWETAKANEVASAILAEHPNLKAFLCANDSMALGAVAALRAAGKEKSVLVVGFDNISAVHQLVRDGTVLATADQHGDRIAVFGVEYALEMLRTKGAAADRETPVDLVTTESLR